MHYCVSCGRALFCCCTMAMLHGHPVAFRLFSTCCLPCWSRPPLPDCVLSACVTPFHDRHATHESALPHPGEQALKIQSANALVPADCSGHHPAWGSERDRNAAFYRPVFRCVFLRAQRPGLPDHGDALYLAGSDDQFSAAGRCRCMSHCGCMFPCPRHCSRRDANSIVMAWRWPEPAWWG